MTNLLLRCFENRGEFYFGILLVPSSKPLDLNMSMGFFWEFTGNQSGNSSGDSGDLNNHWKYLQGVFQNLLQEFPQKFVRRFLHKFLQWNKKNLSHVHAGIYFTIPLRWYFYLQILVQNLRNSSLGFSKNSLKNENLQWLQQKFLQGFFLESTLTVTLEKSLWMSYLFRYSTRDFSEIFLEIAENDLRVL